MASKVFVCYSHQDDVWRRALREQLEPFVRQSDLEVWDDTHIEAGDLWRDRIRGALDTADAGVLLVSPSFLASEFITRDEVPVLLEAAVARGARVLCVYARPSLVGRLHYEYSHPKTGARQLRRLTEFQGLNAPERTLDALDDAQRGAELTRIAGAILDMAAGRRVAHVPGAPRAVPYPRPYLEKLRNNTRRLDVRGLGAKVAEQVELQRVYTRLRVTGPARAGELPGRDKQPRAEAEQSRSGEVELRDLLGAHDNLVLVGDPGAGKTTFLRFVALNLSRALLGEERDACLERLGLDGPVPFPVFVSLGGLGQFLHDHSRPDLPDDAPEHFYRHLDYLGRGVGGGLPETVLRERVLAGGCLLLLDALDEVPSEKMRERVGTIVDQVVGAGRPLGNRHVVTCRTRAYQGKVQLGEEFTRGTLVDFGPEQIEAFVTQWSRALFRVPAGATSGAEVQEADRHRADLLAAIRAHPHVQPLTANPLLLTILAVVHWSKKKLPEQRADLYEAAIEYLLEARETHSPHGSTLRKDCLQALALRLFEDEPRGRQTLGWHAAAETVACFFKGDLARAAAFVEDEELHSGILVSRVEGEVEFWHLTFAEYLAALALAPRPDYWERLRPHLYDERWNEVVLLVAGCRRRQGLALASDFIARILEATRPLGWARVRQALWRLARRHGDGLTARAQALALVGRILRDIRPAGGDPEEGTGYAEARHDVLAIFERGSAVAETVRVEVGETLGAAGDPRLHADDHANRVFIRGGTFWMGAQKTDRQGAGYDSDCDGDEAPVHRVTVSGFWMDRYPVTVGQYRRFVEAGEHGYLAARFWQPEGWQWRTQSQRVSPAAWEKQVPHPNRPVTSVRWHEADAYCAWLRATTGRDVRLPTEAQWEYAARGAAGRRYPWGDEQPTDRHANFGMRVGKPTPVGIYPLGATPEGVYDLAGNVWEWCADWYGGYEEQEVTDPVGPRKAQFRVWRGGGFDYFPFLCRAAYRFCGAPDLGSDDVGFRCVVLGAGGHNE